MTRKRRKATPRRQASRQTQSSSPSHGKKTHRTRWVGLAVVGLVAASAVGGVLWTRAESGSANEQAYTAERGGATEQAVSDVYYVHNRQCAMSDSPIAEKDMGRFESRVVYDGPIERFRGKTLVFNQCCSMCIESFPAKWAAERDQIMAKFGLADVQ